MMRLAVHKRVLVAGLTFIVALVGAGCHSTDQFVAPEVQPIPRELAKVSHPTYVIETPDVLQIDALRVVPRPPYRIEPLDSLFIRATNVLEEEPIAGVYGVEPEGRVTLGQSYGTVEVAGMTLPEAQDAISKALLRTFKNVQVSVSLAQSGAVQQIRGEHLVRPDGTVGLGSYGAVYVAGCTLFEAKRRIEEHLSQFLLNPEVSIDVLSYNSKSYYIVTDGGGYGEQVYRFPSTGNETVLDALAQINGLPVVANKKRIWVARPAPADFGGCQILPVDWKAITRGGVTATNYQLLPGDRIFVEADKLVTVDTYLSRVISPIERLFGITLLGSATVRSFQNNQNGGVGFVGGF